MKHTARYYFILFTLVFLFIAPGLSAYFFYFHPQWLSSSTTNKGQFVNPPILISALESTPKKWQFVLWSPDTCDALCMKQLDQLARVRVALGRRLYDVDLILLMKENQAQLSAEYAKILRDQGIFERRLSANESKVLLSRYNNPMFFIANQEQYLVLAYQTTSQSHDLFHDIKLLLTKGTSK
jgi:hypothetical protein